MWLNIFMTVFGSIIVIIIGIIALASFSSYSTSKGELKKAWKRAFEGWMILFLFITIDLIARILRWIFN